MSAGESQEYERFAAALERGYGVASVPPGDEALRDDLRIAEMLTRSRASLAPGADASARMRATVMAAAATMLPAAPDRRSFDNADTQVNGIAVLDEPTGTVDNVVAIGSARGRHRSPATPSSTAAAVNPRRRGLLGISAAAGLLVLAVTGGGALFSRDALPGDSLYGMKQTTESALTGLTSGQARAQRLLDSASTRLDEVKQLSTQPPSAARDADIQQTLREFDEQSAAGSRTRTASGAANPAELGALSNWAQSQSTRLSSMRTDLPPAAQADADHSLRQLEDIRTRSQQLSNRQGCGSVTGTQTDQLGPLPARGPCSGRVAVSGPNTASVLPPASSTDSSSSDRPSESTESSSHSATRSADQSSSRHSVLDGSRGDVDNGGLVIPDKRNIRDSVTPTEESDHKPDGLVGGFVGGLLGK